MPDLNLADPDLRAELEAVMAFWLDKGVAGFRLDAVKEYVSGNTAANIDILGWVNAAVKGIDPGAYLVAEDWDTTAGYYEYYASGVDSLFNFPFATAEGATAKAVLGTLAPEGYARALAQVPEEIARYSETGTDAPFFTNHDTARAAGFLRRDEDLIKLAWGLNLMQSGNAFVYYGEELGMGGSGKDENKRAPMFWTDDPKADGMTAGPPGMEPQQNSFAPAAGQIKDEGSILQYVRRAIALRGTCPAIARGAARLAALPGDTAAVAVEKTWEGDTVLLVYNLTGEATETALPAEMAGAGLAGWLSSGGAAVTAEGEGLALPPYSIAVLRR